MIRYPWECNKGGGLSLAMRKFSEVIDDLELKYISLWGIPLLGRVG